MNREILFRGKRKDNGELAYGYLFKSWNRMFLLWGMTDDVPNMVEVKPETVGEFTNLTDKNDNEIFEGDIVKCYSLEYGYTNKAVYYNQDKARFVLSSLGTDYDFDEFITLEVIGNIYDKDIYELLKEYEK